MIFPFFSSRADASLEEQAAPGGSGITPQEGCHEGVKPVCDGWKLTAILQKCIYNLGSWSLTLPKQSYRCWKDCPDFHTVSHVTSVSLRWAQTAEEKAPMTRVLTHTFTNLRVQIQTSPIIHLNPHTLLWMVITDMKPAVQHRACN